MNAPHYPPTSEAVDTALFQAVSSLERSTEDGLRRVERRLDDMVTKGEFNATIARLDARDDHLNSKVDTGFKDMEVKVAEGFNTVREADRERNTKNRWFWTLLVSFAGVVSGAVFGVITLVSNAS